MDRREAAINVSGQKLWFRDSACVNPIPLGSSEYLMGFSPPV